MSPEVSVYDVLADKIREQREDYIKLREEQTAQGKIQSALRRDVNILGMFVFGIVMAIVKLWITEK